MGLFRHLPVVSFLDATNNFEQLEPGVWTETALGAKVEEAAGWQTVRVRREQVGSTARLRGVLAVKAGQELVAGETVLTLPVGFRPPLKIRMAIVVEAGDVRTEITAAGVMVLNENIKETRAIYLDGLTWNLT